MDPVWVRYSLPAPQSLRRPLKVLEVFWWSMGIEGDVLPLPVRSAMGGDPLSIMEHLDCRCGQADLDLLADQGVGNAVKAPVNVDMVVDVDSRLLPLMQLETLSGKWLQRRPVQFLEELRRDLPIPAWDGRSVSSSSQAMASLSSARLEEGAIAEHRQDSALGV